MSQSFHQNDRSGSQSMIKDEISLDGPGSQSLIINAKQAEGGQYQGNRRSSYPQAPVAQISSKSQSKSPNVVKQPR